MWRSHDIESYGPGLSPAAVRVAFPMDRTAGACILPSRAAASCRAASGLLLLSGLALSLASAGLTAAGAAPREPASAAPVAPPGAGPVAPPGAALIGPTGQTLVVPAADMPLCLVVPLPEGVQLSGREVLRLLPATAADDTKHPLLLAQVVAVPAADGTPDAERRALAAVVAPGAKPLAPQRFLVSEEKHDADTPAAAVGFEFRDISAVSLGLYECGRPVLTYNHGTVVGEKVPENDVRRQRSCYIHPLWGLGGEVLTDDFPADHYHHHGVFWTWPHVKCGGREYDLWMGKGIRQQFVRWLERRSGPVCAVLAVENGWFAGDEKLMTERVWLRVFRSQADWRAVDLEFTWIPVDRPITLQGADGKSYGGLTVRFAPRDLRATAITVPDGRTTDDLYNTRLKWVDFTSRFDQMEGPSGAAIFVRPDHPDYPPTWLTRHYGPQCVGWPGVEGKTFPPGKPIRTAYRIWIHRSAGQLDQLARAYQSWLDGLEARWE